MPWNGDFPFQAGLAASLMALLAGGTAQAMEPKEPGGYLDQKEFFKPELTISTSNVAAGPGPRGAPQPRRWESFLAAREQAGEGTVHAFIDPRSGAATNLLGSFPLIPGAAGGKHGGPGGTPSATSCGGTASCWASTRQLGAARADAGDPGALAGQHPADLRGRAGARRRGWRPRSATATWS